jgi:hypothetical protein
MKIQLSIYLIISLSLTNCSNNNDEISSAKIDSTKNVQDTSKYNGILSLAVGNYWIYSDSTLAEKDTVKIIGTDTANGLLWWKMNNSSFATTDLMTEFAVRKDTIFVKQPNMLGGYIVSLILIPPRDSSITYFHLSGSDLLVSRKVQKVNQPITVLAGTFPQYFTYVKDIGSNTDSLVLVPGIGIVYHSYKWQSSPGNIYHKLFYQLNKYHLN